MSFHGRRDTERGARVTPRPFPRFQREVAALLVAGHRYTREKALSAVARWRRVVASRWHKGQPPCVVSDHIAKYEREGIICPCGTSSRDPERHTPPCILVDAYMDDYGTGTKDALLRKGRPGQSVMCRSSKKGEMVDVHPVARDVQVIVIDDAKKRKKPFYRRKKRFNPYAYRRKVVKR